MNSCSVLQVTLEVVAAVASSARRRSSVAVAGLAEDDVVGVGQLAASGADASTVPANSPRIPTCSWRSRQGWLKNVSDSRWSAVGHHDLA